MLARLVDEHEVRDVSYWAVRDYMVRRRPEITAEGGPAGCRRRCRSAQSGRKGRGGGGGVISSR